MPEDIEPGPYTDVMPDMSESEYKALKRSIDTTGFDETQPIVVDGDGNIVDGHHRYRACQDLGVDPEVVVDEDATPEDAYRRNLARRNLEGGTKRAIVQLYLTKHYDDDRTQEEIAAELGVAQSTVSEAWKRIEGDNFTRDEKRQQARAYLDDNPDASNREVAREIEADVSHPTIGSWREEWDSDEDEDASVDGDGAEVSGPQGVSGPTESVSGTDNDTDGEGGEGVEEIADRGDDNVGVDVVDNGPGGENDAPASAVPGDEDCNADHASIENGESCSECGFVAPLPKADPPEDDSDDSTDGTDEADLDVEDFESFDPDEYELDPETREDVEQLCRDVLGDGVDAQELEGRVDELEAVLEDMVRAFENQDVQTLERVAQGRAREVLDA